MTKSQTVDLLKNQMPGFYSVEQVISLIERIEEEQVKPKLLDFQIRDITNSIMSEIQEEASRDNIIDVNEIEFEISYDKRIEVTDVPINFDVIRDCIENSLVDTFGPQEEETDNE
jgi:hypothetical protein